MKNLLLGTLALTMGLTACSASAYQKISASKAKDMMAKGNVIIVDVRTQDEYNEGHIQGSILIPNETISNQPPVLLPNKDAVILLYCRSGNRSKQAADKLVAMGYSKVYDFGGVNDWKYGLVK